MQHNKIIFIEKVNNLVIREHHAKLFPASRSLQDSEVIIKEYFGIDITFECDDPDARLYVEKLLDDGEVTILPGQTVPIMPSGNSEDMIVPGEYLLRMTTKNEVYEGFYSVVPKNYSDESIRNLRVHLETVLKGLTYQLDKKRSGVYSSDMDLPPTAYFILDKILENYLSLKYFLNSINDNPISDVRKNYQEMIGSRKPDMRSIRWLLGKGSSRNATPSSPIFVNEKHSYLCTNNAENRFIVHIVKYLLRSLRILAVSLNDSKEVKEKRIERLIVEKQDLDNRIRRQQSNPFHTFSDFRPGIYELIKLRDRIEKDRIPQLERELDGLEQKRKKLVSVTSTLMQFEKNTWYQEIKVGKVERVPYRMFKDTRYSFMYRFYRELKHLEDEQLTTQKAVYPRKKNSLLLEYYIVTQIIDILYEQNYNWISGWLLDNPNPLLAELPSGEIMKFEKDDHYIEIAYDLDIERRSKIDTDASYSRFVCGYDCRPDIRISIHDKEKDTVKSAQIIEVKYRRFQYLYNEDIQTKVMDQCVRYTSIEYFDALTGKPRQIVENVIVVYPRQKGIAPVQGKQGNSIVFVQIEPSDPNTEEKPFGYTQLRERVLEFLHEHIDKGGNKDG